MSENVGRCRAAIGLLEAARGLIEAAHGEAGGLLWEGCQRDERTIMKSIERVQQRLVLKHDEKASASTGAPRK
jgi:hypothetical protein